MTFRKFYIYVMNTSRIVLDLPEVNSVLTATYKSDYTVPTLICKYVQKAGTKFRTGEAGFSHYQTTRENESTFAGE